MTDTYVNILSVFSEKVGVQSFGKSTHINIKLKKRFIYFFYLCTYVFPV